MVVCHTKPWEEQDLKMQAWIQEELNKGTLDFAKLERVVVKE